MNRRGGAGPDTSGGGFAFPWLGARRQRGLWLLLAGVGAALFWSPFFRTDDLTGFGDWQWFHRQWEVARIAILRYGELPLWDPSQCGGSSLWGQPQNQIFAPFYLLFGLPFGTVLGSKLWAIAHTFVGVVGMAWLARREYRLDPSASLVAASVFGFCGFFAWHGAGGHATYFAFYYLPWLILGHRRSIEDRRYCAMVAAVFAIGLLEGAHYPVPYFLLVMVFEGVRALWVHRRALRSVVLAELLSGALVLMLGAFRLVPIARAVVDNPRDVPTLDSLSLSDALLMFTAREHGWVFPGHVWVWPEYGSYVGWATIGLATVGLLLCIRHHKDLVLGFGISFAIMLGDHGALWPWSLMHRLPFYERLHLPSRFAVFVTFYGALAAATALDATRRRVAVQRPRARQALHLGLWAVALTITADLMVVNVRTNDRWNHPPLHEGAPDGRYHLVSGARFHEEFASYARRNVGVRECYDATNWAVSDSLWIGDRAQARFVEGAGDVLDWERRNTSAFALVDVREPADAGLQPERSGRLVQQHRPHRCARWAARGP